MNVEQALSKAEQGYSDQSITRAQATDLFRLAEPYNRAGAVIIELGTKYGYSAAILAQACPLARVKTVDINMPSTTLSVIMGQFQNITAVRGVSWEYAVNFEDGAVDMVFVDADHSRATDDAVAWWPKLKPGGLMLFHDYADRFPNVKEAVSELIPVCARMEILDGDTGEDMAAVYK